MQMHEIHTTKFVSFNFVYIRIIKGGSRHMHVHYLIVDAMEI